MIRQFSRYLFLLLLSVASRTSAQDSVTWHLETFGDFAYKIGGDSINDDLQYTGIPRDFREFQIRRALIGATVSLSKYFSASTSIEHHDGILLPNGQYGLILKTAFLSWKDIYPNATLNIGLTSTPTWGVGMSEKLWNYRGIEKTIADMRGLAGSTDLGVLLKGSVGADNAFNYAAMIANGSFFKPENDKYARYYAMANYRVFGHLIGEVYADYEAQASDKYLYTVKTILAWEGDPVTVGIEVVDQHDRCDCYMNGEKNGVGISSYVHGMFLSDPGLGAFLRFDHWNPDVNRENSRDAENFVTAGFDYRPLPEIRIMPNIWFDQYVSRTRDAQIVGRLTFWYTYN